MIYLYDVGKSYRSPTGRRVILHPTTLAIPSHRAVAILGRNGAGKSTLLRLISGVEPPDQGRIVRTTSMSWPIGFGGGVHSTLTGRQNAQLVADLHGADVDKVMEFVVDFAELGDYIDMRVETYSSGMRSRLNFAISFAIDFDCYLIDEATATGDKRFREKSLAAFNDRRSRSGLLFISHSPNTVRQFCDMGIVLRRGRLVPFENLEEAIRYYESEPGL